MRDVLPSEPKFLEVFSSLNEGRFSAGAEICRFFPVCARGVFRPEPKFQAKYSNVWMRGVFRPDPKFLAIFTNLDAWGFFSQDPISWRYFPGQMRCPFQSEPKTLATFPRMNARLFSARTKIPCDIFKFECEVLFGQDRNSWPRVPV